MENQKFNIVSAQSNVDWVGRKVTGPHHGTIAVKNGEIVLSDGKLVGGSVIIDTRSIKILDLTDSDTNKQLFAHLSSDDFFATDKYPEAILNVTSVAGNHVKSDLKIKNITHPVEFDVVVDLNRDVLTVTGKLVIDRTKYGMKFRSGNFFKNLGDTLIYNDFEINVNVTAGAA